MSNAEEGFLEKDPRLIDDADLSLRPHRDPVFFAHRALQISLSGVLMLAGLDKFANVLVFWPDYLAPMFPEILGVEFQSLMYIIGALEIVLGIGLTIRPRVFAYLSALWLSAIIVNLLISGVNYDLALHDVGLIAAAYALARLSHAREYRAIPDMSFRSPFGLT